MPALFLDHDGVAIEDCHHLNDPDQVQLCLDSRQLSTFAYCDFQANVAAGMAILFYVSKSHGQKARVLVVQRHEQRLEAFPWHLLNQGTPALR